MPINVVSIAPVCITTAILYYELSAVLLYSPLATYSSVHKWL